MTGRAFALAMAALDEANGPEDQPPSQDARAEWDKIDWRPHEEQVRRLRQRIFKAAQEQDWPRVRNLQKTARPRGLLEPCAAMSGTHGSEGGPAFAQSSRELKDVQRELWLAQVLWCVLVLGLAGTGLARLRSLQSLARLPVLLAVSSRRASRLAWSRSGCSWRVTLPGVRG